MTVSPRDPYLLTPGPITTSLETKRAMLRDLGSRDGAFIELNARVASRLLALANAGDSHVAVPVQGSGTFGVEAALGTLVPRDGKVLVLVNGAYGRRMVRILEILGREVAALECPEDRPNDTAALESALAADGSLTHVAAVYCETTSGILNPIGEIAAITAGSGRRLIVDAISAFGALPLDAGEIPFEAAVVSANKCLEGVPGVAYVLVERRALEAAAGRAHSLSLDLHDQWKAMESNGQWRFTPPTHVIAALDRALEAHAAEGGVAGRNARYRKNCAILVAGMREMGFETLLPDALQAPIIVTFLMPEDPAFRFETFYDKLRNRGFVIYPGKLTATDSFRIGCIGHIGADEMRGALQAIREVLDEMGVARGTPAGPDGGEGEARSGGAQAGNAGNPTAAPGREPRG